MPQKLLLCFVLNMLVIAALWAMSFAPARAADSVQYSKVPETVNAGYTLLTPSKIVDRIVDGKGQRRILFLYASWCGYCRGALPEVMAMEKRHPGSVLAVSIDKYPNDLVRYMRKYPHSPLELIVWDRSENLQVQLGRLGIDLPGGIPFVAVFDEGNSVVEQGYLVLKNVAAYLNEGAS